MADSKVKQAKDELSLNSFMYQKEKKYWKDWEMSKEQRSQAEGHSISQPENLNNDNNGL